VGATREGNSTQRRNFPFLEEKDRERVQSSGEWGAPRRKGPTIINRAWRLSFGILDHFKFHH